MPAVKTSEEKIPQHHKNQWFGFIKSIATFRGDLASLTAPPFLLSPQSIVEFSGYWAEHPSLLVAPASEDDPEKRALLVLRWFLSTLKQQHNNKDEQGKKKRMKPLNPFLGELFLGSWEDECGKTELIAEQVSHHPAATASYIKNEKHGIRLFGYIAPKVSFSGTVHIDRKGYSLLHIDKYDEDYLITMPKIHIEGLMTGSLSPELSGRTYIRSSSGYTIKIDYTSKGWVSGKKNGFSAQLFHDDDEKTPLYTVDGQWSDSWKCTNLKTNKVAEEFTMNSAKRAPLKVAPVNEQHPLESRRAWQHVAQAISNGDMFAIGYEKSKIENEQREMRKNEKAEGTQFPCRYFSRLDEDPVAKNLAQGIKYVSIAADMDIQHGAWVWDEAKSQRLEASKRIRSPTRSRLDSAISGMVMEPI
ncbi:hypothetical protein BJ878DRAFT_452011 [Calycina marina]|uniref:Oxysterol-binding protein n=1 Tax=Calycina marina TaxID=1763456 RepID=A0A9P7ZAM3_9HELO|nr:hypothetical protein BJ878DRAFT_452011 [Calycina marina]